MRQVPQHTYVHSGRAVFHTANPPIVFNVDSHRGVTLAEAYQNGGLLTGATNQIWLGSSTKISHRLRVSRQALHSCHCPHSCRLFPGHRSAAIQIRQAGSVVSLDRPSYTLEQAQDCFPRCSYCQRLSGYHWRNVATIRRD